MTRLSLSLCLVFALFAFPSRLHAAEGPDIERIRQHMARLFDQEAQRLIAEQPTRADKADAALAIGALIETGKMSAADPLSAMEYYRMATEFGSAEAECILGNIYYNGTYNVRRDVEKAMEHYKKAAEGGSASAMLQLGVIHADGLGIEADSKAAMPYLRDAAMRGDAEALRRLEPVMRQAREWEEAKPGRKANFPTSREEMVNAELVKQQEARNIRLGRLSSRLLVEMSKRVAEAMKNDMPDFPMVGGD